MALTKITSDVIGTGAITSDKLASGAVSASSLSSITTDNVSEGSTNTYFTNARARGSVSVTGGNLSYDSGTGVIQLTTDQIRTAVSGSTPTFGNITTTGYIAGPATFTIDPAAVGDNTGTVIIAGNLQVDGTTTTINSTTMEVDDLNITLASGAANAAAANGAGITVDGASATITYDGTNDEWDFNKNVNVTGTVTADGLTVDGDATSAGTIGVVADGGTLSTGKDSSSTRTQIAMYNPTGQVAKFDTNSDDLLLNVADNFRIYTAASERLRLDSSGNVGIGTTSPSSFSGDGNNLVIGTTSGDNGLSIISGTSSSGSIYFGDTQETGSLSRRGQLVYNHSDDSMRVFTASSEKMRIDLSGNVGIGETNPTEKLTVAGAITTTGALSDDRTSTGSMDFVSGYTRFVAYGASGETGAFTFNTAEGGSSSSQKVVIDGLGRIGVGTIDPQTYIHIKTTSPGISFTDTNSFSDTNDRFQIRANSNNGQFQWYDDSTGATNTHMTILEDGKVLIGGENATFGVLGVESSGNCTADFFSNSGSSTAAKTELFFSGGISGNSHVSLASIVAEQAAGDEATRKGQLRFLTANSGGPSTAMTIAANGKVGIQKTSPYYNLHVEEAIATYTSNAAGSNTIDSNTIILTKYAAGNADANQNENTDDIYFTEDDFGFPSSAYGVNVVGYFYASNRLSGVSSGSSGHIWRVAGSLDSGQQVAMSMVNEVDNSQSFGGGTNLKIIGSFNSTIGRFEFGVTWEYGAGGYGTVTFIGQATEAMG